MLYLVVSWYLPSVVAFIHYVVSWYFPSVLALIGTLVLCSIEITRVCQPLKCLLLLLVKDIFLCILFQSILSEDYMSKAQHIKHRDGSLAELLYPCSKLFFPKNDMSNAKACKPKR